MNIMKNVYRKVPHSLYSISAAIR